jgi:small conductance mechanosensitive channel
MGEESSKVADEILTFISTYGLDVLGGIVILIVGLFVAGFAKRLTYKLLGRSQRMDETVRIFFSSAVKMFIIGIVIIAVLSNFGVEIASLIAVFGAFGLAVGFAVQGVLSSVAAGVMLLLFRPFKVGDYIEAGGHGGTVKSLTLTTVELATPDNVQIIVPNSQVWGAAIKNFSFHETRRVDVAVGIGYEDDIDAAKATINALIAADKRAHAEPALVIAVTGLGDN